MNEVSIIINGVRYDAVEIEHDRPAYLCEHCDLDNNGCNILSSCPLELFYVFKKSNKKFEV